MKGLEGSDVASVELAREANEASALLSELEKGTALSALLPAIRRLAESRNDFEVTEWLRLEILGYDGWQMTDPKLDTAVRARIVDRYIRLHQIADPAADFDRYRVLRRSLLAAAPVAELERSAPPAELTRPVVHNEVVIWDMRSKAHNENRLLLVRVREELDEYLSSILASIQRFQATRRLFGENAIMVLAAGGDLLSELEGAVAELARPGRHASAAIGARTALLTMGRELYDGATVHTSPITGKTFRVVSEKHMLHAYLDGLWSRGDATQRALIETAIQDLDLAYQLGSKAKNPLVLSLAEAELAVRKAYSVASAIALSGGFSARAKRS